MTKYLYKEWIGQSVQVASDQVQLCTTPATAGSGMLFYAQVGTQFILTGYYYQIDNWIYAQVSQQALYLVLDSNASIPEVNFMDQCNTATTYQAEELLAQLLRDQQRIYENNLVCARFAQRLTRQEAQQVLELQHRLEVRNADIEKNSEAFSHIETASPTGYEQLRPYLDALEAKVGIALSSAIVIAVVIGASLSTAVYFAYQYYAAEAAKDVKFSDELTRTLMERLTPEDYEQLMEETRGLVSQQVLSQKLKAGGKTILIIGCVVLGLILPQLINRTQEAVAV